jgi:hypothetical protein
LSSEARNQARVSSDPDSARFKGSNGPTGAVDPGKLERSALSKVLDLLWEEGAKAAAAEPARARNRMDFIFAILNYFVLERKCV